MTWILYSGVQGRFIKVDGMEVEFVSAEWEQQVVSFSPKQVGG